AESCRKSCSRVRVAVSKERTRGREVGGGSRNTEQRMSERRQPRLISPLEFRAAHEIERPLLYFKILEGRHTRTLRTDLHRHLTGTTVIEVHRKIALDSEILVEVSGNRSLKSIRTAGVVTEELRKRKTAVPSWCFIALEVTVHRIAAKDFELGVRVGAR